jgi:NADPH-dependent 2,4-dienoyl-CoA reductase/sulfur reductase-like enzyme
MAHQLVMLTLLLALTLQLTATSATEVINCDVVIVGGTTASFAAAISSAAEGVQTCLLEPTDWVGLYERPRPPMTTVALDGMCLSR